MYVATSVPTTRRDLGERTLLAGLRRRPHVHRAEVVLDDSRLLLLLGVRRLEVVVEVASERRRPGEAPAHPPLVRLQLRERSPRHRAERDVVIREVDDEAVEAVRDRRAGRTPCRVLGPEHEVVDEELRASSEEIGERGAPLVGLEAVLLVDSNPRQLLPLPRQLVAAPRQLLLGLEQLEPGRKPLFTCSGLVVGHCLSPSCHYNSLAWPERPMTSHIGGERCRQRGCRRGCPSAPHCGESCRPAMALMLCLSELGLGGDIDVRPFSRPNTFALTSGRGIWSHTG